jgi:hypothetical protein
LSAQPTLLSPLHHIIDLTMAHQDEPETIEEAMHHLKLKGLYPRGPFSEYFPGLRPTLAQRRRYMRAFFQWHLYDGKPEAHERELRERGELIAATDFIEMEIVGAPEVVFEYAVDKEVWELWCEYGYSSHVKLILIMKLVSRCPEESVPSWPWPCPNPEEGAPESSRFAELLAKYKREGTLFPSPTEPTNAEVEGTMWSNSVAPTGDSDKATHTVQSARTAAPISAGVNASFASTMTDRRNVPESGVEPTIPAPESKEAPPAVETAPAKIPPTESVPAAIEPSSPNPVMATSSQAARSPAEPAEARLTPTTRPNTEQTPKESMDVSKKTHAPLRTSVKATLVEEKVFPYPCTPPDLGLRRML